MVCAGADKAKTKTPSAAKDFCTDRTKMGFWGIVNSLTSSTELKSKTLEVFSTYVNSEGSLTSTPR